MADVIVEKPTAEQFIEYSRGMKRVSYRTVQNTGVASAFILKVAEDGRYMKIKAGTKVYAIHPQFLEEISFYSK
jgi:hypothetical protein